MRMTTSFLLLALTVTLGRAEIVSEEITYTSGDDTLKGYIAYSSDSDQKRPGVLVVHEWWGHNPYARQRARMLAELGYTALAVDMYGDGKLAEHPEDAGKFASQIRANMKLGTARFEAARKTLAAHPMTDPDKIAAIGYCFGGAVVLQMARSGMDLDAVVSFHGSLGTETPAENGSVKARILICHGADDPFVSDEEISAFKEEMSTAGADFRFVAYEGAVHSFTNPEADSFGKKFNLPLAYHAGADAQSWRDMQVLLKEAFATSPPPVP